jgi:hypothetical protein
MSHKACLPIDLKNIAYSNNDFSDEESNLKNLSSVSISESGFKTSILTGELT